MFTVMFAVAFHALVAILLTILLAYTTEILFLATSQVNEQQEPHRCYGVPDFRPYLPFHGRTENKPRHIQ